MKRFLFSMACLLCFLPIAYPFEASAKTASKQFISAVNGRNVSEVRDLLNQKADPNARDSEGFPVLISAAVGGSTEIVELLLSHGADPNISYRKTGVTPIQIASDRGFTEICRLLLEKGASPNPRSRKGCTPLVVASAGGHNAVVKLLLEHKADPNIVCNDGQSPLLRAASHGQSEAVRLLLSHNADPNSRDDNVNTPLHFAVGEKHADIVKMLIEHGAEINARAKGGMTPLMVAADREDPEMMTLLLKAGADPAARNSDGLSASDISSIVTSVQKQISSNIDYDHAGKSFQLKESAIASRSVKSHRNLVVAALMVGAKEEPPRYFSDLMRSLQIEGIVRQLPAGMLVIPTGKADAMLAQVYVRGLPGIWWIPVRELELAGLPTPPVDLEYVNEEAEAGR